MQAAMLYGKFRKVVFPVNYLSNFEVQKFSLFKLETQRMRTCQTNMAAKIEKVHNVVLV